MSQVFEPVPDSQQNPKPAIERPSVSPGTALFRAGPRRKRRVVRNTILLLLVVALTAYGIRVFLAPSGAKGGPDAAKQFPVPVVAGTVVQKDVPIFLDGLGTVRALNTVTVRARVDGELKKVSFAEGQDVKAGDVLAQIDDAPFRALFEQAQAKKGQDEALLANAKLDLERNADLIAKKVISPQQYETQKALVAQLEAAVRADEAAIQNTKVQLDYTTVVSPIAGRTGIRLVDQGNVVHATDARGLVVITQLQPVSLEVKSS